MNNLEPTVPSDLARTVASEVDAEEKIIYAAQPIPRNLAWKAVPIVLIAIPWTGFAILWVAAATIDTARHTPIPVGFPFTLIGLPLFGLPFVVVGFSILTSPYWIIRSARQTIYVVTTRRAIIFKSKFGGGMDILSFTPRDLRNLHRNQSSNGSGDLVFRPDCLGEGNRKVTEVGFLGVPDVKEAETRVRELVENNNAKSKLQ